MKNITSIMSIMNNDLIYSLYTKCLGLYSHIVTYVKPTLTL